MVLAGLVRAVSVLLDLSSLTKIERNGELGGSSHLGGRRGTHSSHVEAYHHDTYRHKRTESRALLRSFSPKYNVDYIVSCVKSCAGTAPERRKSA